MFIQEKVPGGKMVGIDVEFCEGKIEKIRISGDFFLHPENTLTLIEESLIGKTVDAAGEVISGILEQNNAQLIGVRPQDIEEMLRKVA
jgi:lipoate-protein ligase A